MLVRLIPMKSKNKALFGFLLILSVMLTACTPAATAPAGTNAADQTQPTASPTPEQATATPAIEEVDVDLPAGISLVFWHPWSGELADIFQEITEDFNRANTWGIEVAFEGHADQNEMLDDMAAAMAAEALPDILAAPSQVLRMWDQQGVSFRDLNVFIADEESGLSEEDLNAMLPIFWKADVVDDRRLAVPIYRSGNFLFYNRTWAQELGFENLPDTSSAFSQQSCAAAQANIGVANGTGGWLYDDGALTSLSWMQAFSTSSLLDDDGNVDFQEQGNQAGLEYIYDLYMQDCAWTGQQSVPYQYFADRYALFYSGSSEDIFVQEAANLEAENQDEWALIPYPSDESRPVVYVDGWSAAVLSDDEDKAMAAWLFLRYLLDEQTQVGIVEDTGALPLSNAVINEMIDFRQAHPAWAGALQYIALAQNTPLDPVWIQVEPVLADMAWQLRQYNTAREDIPGLLAEADAIILSLKEN